LITVETNRPQTDESPALIAPLWHTGLGIALILIVVLVSALSSHKQPLPKPHSFPFAEYKELFYIALLFAEGALFALVYAGLYIQKMPLAVLIGKPWDDSRDIIRDIAIAVGLIVLIFCLTGLTAYLFGPVDRDQVDTAMLPKTAVQFYFFFLALVAGAAGEEVIFRGYFLKQITFLFKSETAAIVLQGLLFSLAHGGQRGPWLFQKFLIGLFFGYIAVKRKSLMPTIVAHCGINAFAAIAGFIYS
jgi:membrane protease YdiL (CAAX protease family)